MKSILDPSFPYRPSHNTDIANSKAWEDAKKKLEKDKADRDELRKQIEQLPRIGKRQA